jgi:hypothetical protein
MFICMEYLAYATTKKLGEGRYSTAFQTIHKEFCSVVSCVSNDNIKLLWGIRTRPCRQRYLQHICQYSYLKLRVDVTQFLWRQIFLQYLRNLICQRDKNPIPTLKIYFILRHIRLFFMSFQMFQTLSVKIASDNRETLRFSSGTNWKLA